MHGNNNWIMWISVAIYVVMYGAPAAVVAGLAWWAIRRRKRGGN